MKNEIFPIIRKIMHKAARLENFSLNLQSKQLMQKLNPN